MSDEQRRSTYIVSKRVTLGYSFDFLALNALSRRGFSSSGRIQHLEQIKIFSSITMDEIAPEYDVVVLGTGKSLFFKLSSEGQS